MERPRLRVARIRRIRELRENDPFTKLQHQFLKHPVLTSRKLQAAVKVYGLNNTRGEQPEALDQVEQIFSLEQVDWLDAAARRPPLTYHLESYLPPRTLPLTTSSNEPGNAKRAY